MSTERMDRTLHPSAASVLLGSQMQVGRGGGCAPKGNASGNVGRVSAGPQSQKCEEAIQKSPVSSEKNPKWSNNRPPHSKMGRPRKGRPRLFDPVGRPMVTHAKFDNMAALGRPTDPLGSTQWVIHRGSTVGQPTRQFEEISSFSSSRKNLQ